MEDQSPLILRHFQFMDDPRQEKSTLHSVIDILVISFCSALSGIDSFLGMATFAKEKEAWLRGFLPLKNGIPSHDTFRRVFCMLDPKEFESAFIAWMRDAETLTGGAVVAIDGKTLKGSRSKKHGKKAIHLVSAWATQNGLGLGHVKVDEKSNEITAIPEVLNLLKLSGCIITIDAMGCQKEICEIIVKKEAGYVIAVKGNQPKLENALQEHFLRAPSNPNLETFETKENSRGREEIRQYFLDFDTQYIQHLEWPGVEATGHIRSVRIEGGKASYDDRYYILRGVASAAKFAEAARSHWRTENTQHWTLDVTMGEDKNQIRAKNADRNVATLRRIALNKLKKVESGTSIKQRQIKCAISDKFRSKTLEAL